METAKGVPKNPNQEGDKPTTFIHKTQSESTPAAAVSQPVHEEGEDSFLLIFLSVLASFTVRRNAGCHFQVLPRRQQGKWMKSWLQ